MILDGFCGHTYFFSGPQRTSLNIKMNVIIAGRHVTHVCRPSQSIEREVHSSNISPGVHNMAVASGLGVQNEISVAAAVVLSNIVSF